MCLHKRSIRNRVAPYKQSKFDKFMLSVQCNNCPECRKQRQNDWLVRSWFEVTRNDYKSMFFVTLDFDDDHLPVYNGIPCFDSELIKSFFKRIRHYVPQFRYLYSTDYGGALQRPHYHFIAFFKEFVSKFDFMRAVNKCWYYGSHEDIEKLRSGSNLWNCISYVCKYTTKDITFSYDGREKLLPKRYQSRTQSSEKFGFSALEEGLITFDMLKEDKPLYLPVGKNGRCFPYKIPRYYETYLTSYSVYYPEFRRSEWFKTSEGYELQEIRHNRRYVYFMASLLSSIFDPIHRTDSFKVFKSLYPDSPYCSMTWNEILSDCLDDQENFEFFVFNSGFFKRTKDWKLRKCYGKLIDFRFNGDDWTDHLIDLPGADRFNECLHLFKLYNDELDYTKYLIGCFDSVEQSKQRLLNKIQNKPRLRKYLLRKHFDFSKLFDTDILEFTLSFDDFVKKSDTPALKVCKDPSMVRKYCDFRMMRYAS